jgi:hypothetical protein
MMMMVYTCRSVQDNAMPLMPGQNKGQPAVDGAAGQQGRPIRASRKGLLPATCSPDIETPPHHETDVPAVTQPHAPTTLTFHRPLDSASRNTTTLTSGRPLTSATLAPGVPVSADQSVSGPANASARQKDSVIARRLLTIALTDFLCWCGFLLAYFRGGRWGE